jgi:hypothetical protein
MATGVDTQLRGSAVLLYLSLRRHDKDLADTTLGMIGDSEVVWLTEDQSVLCTGCTTRAEGCPGLFGRPGVSAFRIRNEGRWGEKGIEFDCQGRLWCTTIAPW